MLDLDFKEYRAEFEQSDSDEKRVSTVRAARVTRQSKGVEVPTIGGVVSPKVGDVVVATSNPDVFDVCDTAQWKATGYEQVK